MVLHYVLDDRTLMQDDDTLRHRNCLRPVRDDHAGEFQRLDGGVDCLFVPNVQVAGSLVEHENFGALHGAFAGRSRCFCPPDNPEPMSPISVLYDIGPATISGWFAGSCAQT